MEDAIECLLEYKQKQREKERKKQENIKKHSKAVPAKAQKVLTNIDPLNGELLIEAQRNNSNEKLGDTFDEKIIDKTKWNEKYPIIEYTW